MKPDIRALQLSLVTLCLLVLLIFYYPFVYLPFTFTFSNLPAANIPFYLDSQLWPWSWFASAGLYGFFWFVLFTDGGLLVLLGIAFGVIYLEERRENSYLRSVMEKGEEPKTWIKQSTLQWGLLLFTGFGAVIQVFKIAYIIILGLTCDQVQLCRLTTLQKSQNSVTPNGSYFWLSVAQILFFVILIAYFAIFLNIPQQQKMKTKSK